MKRPETPVRTGPSEINRGADETIPGDAGAGTRHVPLSVYCIYLLALSWPLGAYQRVFWEVHLHQLAFIPLALETLAYWKRHKRIQTPFELFWPCAAITALVFVLAVGGRPVSPFKVAGGSAAFVVLYHSVSRRQVVWDALHCSMLAGTVMLLLSVLARLNWIFPTAYDLDTRFVMAGPYSIQEGVVIVGTLLLVLPPFLAAVKAGEYHRTRFAWTTCVLFPAAVLLLIFVPVRVDLPAWRPAHQLFLVPAGVLVLLVLWGCARVAAKLIVAGSYLPKFMTVVLPVVIIVGVCLVMIFGKIPPVGVVVLLALLAAYGKPHLQRETEWHRPFLPAIILAVIVMVNLTVMLPGDPRNYEAEARQALARGDYDGLRANMSFVNSLAPSERRTHYYSARSYFEEGRIFQAVPQFARSLRDGPKPRLLPPPATREIESFLNELRDFSSALPERIRGLAYERALIAAGRERHALSLLELRGEPLMLQGVRSSPLAHALAEALGAPGMGAMLSAWEPGLLAVVLESSGPLNGIWPAPEGFPVHQLPCVVMLLPSDNALHACIFSPAGQGGGVQFVTGEAMPFTDALALALDTGWSDWQPRDDGHWKLRFGDGLAFLIGSSPQVLFTAPIALPADYPLQGGEVRIYLPKEYLTNE